MLKSVYAPHLGRSVKFGRRMPAAVPVTRKPYPAFGTYAAMLPTAPATINFATPATLQSLRNLYGNDSRGDCVPAGANHDLGMWTANAGKPFLPTLDQVLADYTAIGGFDPNDPDNTDNGCDEVTALNYYLNHGFANGTKLAGWLTVDASNQTLVKQALWLFEGLYFGMCLSDRWVDPMPEKDGFVWNSIGRPDPQNGHCVIGYGYNAQGIQIDTWGLFGTVAWDAVKHFASPKAGGELYLLLSQDQINQATQKSPNGFNWTQLATDFAALKAAA